MFFCNVNKQKWTIYTKSTPRPFITITTKIPHNHSTLEHLTVFSTRPCSPKKRWITAYLTYLWSQECCTKQAAQNPLSVFPAPGLNMQWSWWWWWGWLFPKWAWRKATGHQQCWVDSSLPEHLSVDVEGLSSPELLLAQMMDIVRPWQGRCSVWWTSQQPDTWGGERDRRGAMEWCEVCIKDRWGSEQPGLVWSVSAHGKGFWDWMIFNIPPNPNHSITLG